MRTAPTSRRSRRELDVAEQCRLVGFQKSIRPWYAAFDALLLTSANEGTPVVAIEALAAARPVVATRAGRHGTVVRNGESGYLEAIGDTAALADRLALLARDPELRARMGAHGAEDVRERFAVGRMADEVEAIYRRLLRVKVLHLHKLTGVSGSEGHLLALLPALRERGVDAGFLGLDVPGSDANRFYEALDRLDVPHRSVRCGLDVSPRLARDVVRAVRAEGPDLVHTHLVHADIYGGTAARALGIPSLSTRHNDDRYLLGPFRYVDRAFARPARRLIAISDAVRRFLERAGHDPSKLTTIRYGLDELPAAPSEPTPAAAGVPPEAPLALAVGRLIEQKDHATLLRAFARVRATLPDARLAILGSGPLEAETRRLAAELGLEDAVTMPGPDRHPRLARTRRRLRALVALGGVRNRAAGGDARRPAHRCDPRERRPGGRGGRRNRAARRARRRYGPGRGSGSVCSRTALVRPRSATSGLERARTEFSVARMTERTLAVYGDVTEG